MDEIKIKSNLYDYAVEFVDDFSVNLKSFAKIVLVVDKKVHELYREKFSSVDSERIFFMDADESFRQTEKLLESYMHWGGGYTRCNYARL